MLEPLNVMALFPSPLFTWMLEPLKVMALFPSPLHLNAWTLEGDGFVPFFSFHLNAWTLEGDGFVPSFPFHLNAWTLEGDGFDPFFPLPARLFLQLSVKAVHLNVCRQNKCLILLFRKKMNALDERKVKCTVGRSFVFGTARKPRMLCFISDVETHGIYLSPTANSRNKIIHFLWPRFSYTWFLKKKKVNISLWCMDKIQHNVLYYNVVKSFKF